MRLPVYCSDYQLPQLLIATGMDGPIKKHCSNLNILSGKMVRVAQRSI